MLSKRKCDPPSNGGMRSPPISHGLSKRIRSGNRLISFLVALLLIVPLLLLATRLAQTSETPSSNNSSSTCEQLRLPWEGVGLLDPVDSTMLVLFASNSPDNYRYRRYMNMERGTECINSALTLRRSFEEASAAFLTDPYIASHNPFHDFFRDHNATFWEVRGNTAVPLTVDVIYTYVNPAAASFRFHHEIRGIKLSSERRYNDWEELRYSLRSLNRFALGSHSLRQYYHKLEEDTEVLQKLGLTVPNSASLPKYLLTRVFLLLSATDQVPHWLNADAFPNLHVVTHRQLFTADNESFVLPTLNSNAIESALHRIPGLSRFFLYISNDMFVGRQLSFFDIFRPLAPPRQELHLSQLLIRNGKYERCLRDASSSRRVLFFEPILHSETGSPIAKLDPNRAEKEETREMSQQCMNEVVDSVASSIVNAGGEDAQLHALLRAADLPGWKVSPSFSFPNPHTGITAPGEGVGEDYYYYIATTKLEGITPPFGYAHCPFLMDREVMNRLNEHELFYYANATRGAYEREMYPFSPVDIYSIFSLAMTRASTRYQWKFVINYSLGLLHNNDIQLKRIAVVEQVLQEIKSVAHQWSTRGKSRSHRPQASDFGPLFGPSTSYHLQSPRLLVDLGLWWDSQVDRTSVSLSSLYNIPQVGLKIPKSEKVRWYPRLDEQLENLLHDLRHHRLFSDLTYRFEMVHSSLKAALTAARFREEKNRIPLWIGLNDNFPSASSTAEDIRRHKAAFRVLMLAATSNTGAALWEREQLEFIKLNNAPKN